MLTNTPEAKIAIVGVSRDCFPIELTRTRLNNVMEACRSAKVEALACKTIIESEVDAVKALQETEAAQADAAVIYLGNFGPEGPLSIFAERFPGPVMLCAAAEENRNSLIQGRGDAMCGMLSASFNMALREIPVYIPPIPAALPDQIAKQIDHFSKVATILIGLSGLKVFAFGPRPHDFYTCNTPLKGLYDLGVEVMENSELDLLQLFEDTNAAEPEVKNILEEMTEELGAGNQYPDLLPKLARFEVTLRRFADQNIGASQYAAFANKCWPGFESAFGFVPCYVNSRMAGSGIPVACEVDIYGAVSEYLCQLASGSPATLLDINNTVPTDMLESDLDLMGAKPADLFMGFHCGNTASECTKSCQMKYQLIMHRLMEGPDAKPDITRGTLEGQLRPGPVTMFRLQSHDDGWLGSYIAEGNVLDVDPRSFGSIGIISIPDFARFYRHVLLAKSFPHHGAFAFSGCGRILYDAMTMLAADDIDTPLPAMKLYDGENPFE